MKVQTIKTEKGERYIVLDDNYVPIEHINSFLKFNDVISKSPNTLRSYAYHLKTFYEFMQDREYSVLELSSNKEKGPVDILSEFIMYLQHPVISDRILNPQDLTPVHSDSSINNIVGTVLSFYQYLSKNNIINELDVYKNQLINPRFKSFLSELISNKQQLQQSIFKKKTPTKPVAYITRKQFNDLFFLCPCTRDRLLVSLLFEGGLRISEALGIHFEDLDQLEDGILKIVPRENNENGTRVKNYAAGIVLLPPYVVDLLLNYINNDIIEYNSDYLFLNLHGPTKGQPLKARTVEGLFNRLSKKLGYEITPHVLRDSFATEKLEFGWQLEDISAYLRHKNLNSTQIYTHYSDTLKKEKMRDYLDKTNIGHGGLIL